jgi:diadenylate cyclase
MIMENVMHLFSGIRWQDVVDIALMSYIIFRLYILFQGTNVFRGLIGLALLWFFQGAASSVGLIVTSWAIQGVTAVAAIIIIVIYRNEIRSVLQTKNLQSLLWGLHLKSVDTPSDVIVESTFQLAAKHHGALIVMPGKEDIHETVHSGITWEGLVSKEMITSIFWPDNPVHDGAAIIRGNKIIQVGAVLPLSRRTDLPSYYGTRHRAAAGLAEITDALVIVVSEERGRVTAAKGSRLYSISRKEELSAMVEEHLGISFRPARLFKKKKLELGLAALISLFFITGIWLSFTRGIDTLITLEVPVEYINRQPDLEIYDTSVNTVRLDLSGSGPLIKSIKSENIKVTVDLSNAQIGVTNCLISNKNVSLPPGVFLKNIRPPYVEVTLDKSVAKKVPVQIDWTGNLPENTTITSVIIDPPSVKIVGRSTLLKKISTLYTEKVSLDGLSKSGESTVSLVLTSPSLKLEDNLNGVTVRYIIKEKDVNIRQNKIKLRGR